MIMIMVSIFYNDGFNLKYNPYVLLGTSVIFAGTIGVYMYGRDLSEPTNIQLFPLGIFIISVIGYTIYQWKQLSDKSTESKCGFLLPQTRKFREPQYYLYRAIYLITVIAIVALLQFKIQDNNFNVPLIPRSILNYFVFLIPIILPILTEITDTLINSFIYFVPLVTDKQVSNPESLLSNFFLGDAKNDVFIPRSIGPSFLYASMIFIMMDSSYGITGFWQSRENTAIYIALFIVIFFSFIMRSIFIQDCSLDNTITEISEDDDDYINRFDCIFEKYGGIQSMLCTILIIMLIYNIKNPMYKILFFLIICLASWGLSATYILTLKPS